MTTGNKTPRRLSVLFTSIEEVAEVDKAVKKINAQNKKDSFGKDLTRSLFIKNTVLKMAREINSGTYKFKNKK